MTLNGNDLERLRDAFVSVYDADSLEMVLRLKLNQRLNTLVSPTANFETAVFQLLSRAEQAGWLRQLMVVAAENRSQKLEFVTLCHELLAEHSKASELVSTIGTSDAQNPDAASTLLVNRFPKVYELWINRWLQDMFVEEWEVWTKMLTHTQPYCYSRYVDGWGELLRWRLGVDLPGVCPVLDKSILNFSMVLDDLRSHFLKVTIQQGDLYRINMSHKSLPYGSLYEQRHREYEVNITMIDLLTIELTKAGNYLIDQVRVYKDSEFRIAGKLKAILSGNWEAPITMRVDYDRDKQEYVGLQTIIKHAKEHVAEREGE